MLLGSTEFAIVYRYYVAAGACSGLEVMAASKQGRRCGLSSELVKDLVIEILVVKDLHQEAKRNRFDSPL